MIEALAHTEPHLEIDTHEPVVVGLVGFLQWYQR